MNTSNNNSTPIIVAEFDSSSTRQLIHNSFKKNGPIMLKQLFTNTTLESNKLFINEYLTEYTKTLFEDTKKLKSKYNVQFVWIKNGRIYVRESPQT